MEALQYVLYLLVTVTVLVTVHEFGHYLAARASGVRILRFSVGFGRPLLSWTDKRGTAFTLAPIPLGGFLQMYGEGEETGHWQPREGSEYPNIPFDKLSPWWRIIIAAAGPAANFVLAVAVYWAISVAGVTAYIPIVGTVEEDTPAHVAGLRGGEELVSIDGRPTPTWPEVNAALAGRLGDTGEIDIAARRPEQTSTRVYAAPVDQWRRGEAAPERAVSLLVDRGGRELDVLLTPSATSEGGTMIGFAGVEAPVRTIRYSMIEALAWSANETAAKTVLTLNLLGRMFTGTVSPKNLAGPFMIAKIAKDSAQTGWRNFLTILALLSISLGVINLLPIPILDGGHILFACAQIVARRPVPPHVQAIGMRVGLFLVSFAMLFVIYNDVARLL